MKVPKKSGRTSLIERRLKLILGFAFTSMGIRHATAAIFVIPGADMGKMKARYYKKKTSREADVLSFAEPKGFPHPESKKRFLGEIYLNDNLISDSGRLQFLLVHGLLHLLGYSHDKKGDTLKMQSLEGKLINKISKRL